MKRVTGIGGVFFKSRDRERLLQWYSAHLGIPAQEFGAVFRWHPTDAPGETGYTVWSPFDEDTDYFAPSASPLMINYRVADLTALLEALKAEGVQVVGEIDQQPNGKFAWILDPEGNKIELWEPVPSKDDPYL